MSEQRPRDGCPRPDVANEISTTDESFPSTCSKNWRKPGSIMLWSVVGNRRRFAEDGQVFERTMGHELQCQRCRSRSMADRRKDRGRATSGRIEITSGASLRVAPPSDANAFYGNFDICVKVKRGSLVSCFFFLICNSEGEVFEESRIRKSADENVLSFF